ncbi:hypothetical protein NFJ02_38g95980 [Pycnococcus provasolii]
MPPNAAPRPVLVTASPARSVVPSSLGAVADLTQPLVNASQAMVREYEEEITSLVNAREAEISRIQGFVASATKELVRAKESEEKRLNEHMFLLRKNFETAMAALEAQVRELVAQSTVAMEHELANQRDCSKQMLEDKAQELVAMLAGDAPSAPPSSARRVAPTSARRPATATPSAPSLSLPQSRPSTSVPHSQQALPSTPRREIMAAAPTSTPRTAVSAQRARPATAASAVTPIYRNASPGGDMYVSPAQQSLAPSPAPEDPVERARAMRASAEQRLSARKIERTPQPKSSPEQRQRRGSTMSGMRAERAVNDLSSSLDISPKRQNSRHLLSSRAAHAQQWLARPVKVRDVVGEGMKLGA